MKCLSGGHKCYKFIVLDACVAAIFSVRLHYPAQVKIECGKGLIHSTGIYLLEALSAELVYSCRMYEAMPYSIFIFPSRF